MEKNKGRWGNGQRDWGHAVFDAPTREVFSKEVTFERKLRWSGGWASWRLGRRVFHVEETWNQKVLVWLSPSETLPHYTHWGVGGTWHVAGAYPCGDHMVRWNLFSCPPVHQLLHLLFYLQWPFFSLSASLFLNISPNLSALVSLACLGPCPSTFDHTP